MENYNYPSEGDCSTREIELALEQLAVLIRVNRRRGRRIRRRRKRTIEMKTIGLLDLDYLLIDLLALRRRGVGGGGGRRRRGDDFL